MDGRQASILLPGESVDVEASQHPIPCINRTSAASPSPTGGNDEGRDNWVSDINTLLGFNVSFKANGGER